MQERTIRAEMLLGADAMDKLARSRVIVFGIGGVGGAVAEGLARAGVGTIDLVDHDTISTTNLNRQIAALSSTIGLPKAKVMAERTTARTAAFMPGESPPLVSTPIRLIFLSIYDSPFPLRVR